ncbi:hypothetical protein [uncultured Paludibaculum sp.]|uniref:hypothetical protein n=1 Tax=uncultured Paludibaculum sp. TaxID=1765020 RepID=UPI002AABEA3A|nr:hypothetical protein [uncultured Paludibaculum sp.]
MGGLRGECGQAPLHLIDVTADPAMVGQESFGGGGLLGEPERCPVGAAIGFGAGGIKEGAFESMPAEFVGLEHAAVDKEQAGPAVGAGGSAAEGVVQPLIGEVRGQLERKRTGRSLAGVLTGDALAGFGAGSGGLPGVGAVGGQAASGLGDLGGVG